MAFPPSHAVDLLRSSLAGVSPELLPFDHEVVIVIITSVVMILLAFKAHKQQLEAALTDNILSD